MFKFLIGTCFLCLVLQRTYANCGDLYHLLASENYYPRAGYFWSSCNNHCAQLTEGKLICDEKFLEDMMSACSNVFSQQYTPCTDAAQTFFDSIQQVQSNDPPSPQKTFDGKLIEVDPIVPDEDADPGSDRRKLCARFKNTGTENARFTVSLDAYKISDPSKTSITIASSSQGWDILVGELQETCVFVSVSGDEYNLEDYLLKLAVTIDADQGTFEIVDRCKKQECLKL